MVQFYKVRPGSSYKMELWPLYMALYMGFTRVFVTPTSGVTTLLTTGRGPLCGQSTVIPKPEFNNSTCKQSTYTLDLSEGIYM